jgi:RNA polymerase sigma factor (sigma-70 family)
MTKKVTMDESRFLSEQLLIERLRKGENEAWECLYERFLPDVSVELLRVGAREDEVDDIFQESLLALGKMLSQSSFQLRHSLRALITKIAKNKLYSQKKGKGGKNLGEEHIPEGIYEDQEEQGAIELEQLRCLYSAIADLKEDDQELIFDRFYLGLSYEEIVEKQHPALFDPRNEAEIKKKANSLRNKVWHILKRFKKGLS